MGSLLSQEEYALLKSRRKVALIEENMRLLPQVPIPVEHFWGGGVYARKITIPEGTLVTGEIHKYENLNVMSGDIIVLVDGEGVMRMCGSHVVVSPPGIKRIAFAVKETSWVTVLPTREQNPDAIRKLFVASTEEEYQQFLMLACMEAPQCLS